MTPYFVYIVSCKDGTFYTGIATNLGKRIDQHNRGKGAKYTRGRLPVALAYIGVETSLSGALKEERRIKKLSRAEKFKLIRQHAVKTEDLQHLRGMK